MAAKLVSVLSLRMATRLNSFSLQKKFWRGSYQGNTQNEKSPYYQSSIDFRCYLEMALFEPRREQYPRQGHSVLPVGPEPASSSGNDGNVVTPANRGFSL